MGLYFRKSISLGHGMRMNFSKGGIGFSAGVKGLRVSTGPRGTRATASIPGTGIYYTKQLNSPSKQHVAPARTQSSRYQYQQTVTNAYTGQSRLVRANSAWELQSLIEAENARQQVAELRQRDADQRQSLKDQAVALTNDQQERRKSIGSIVRHTLSIDDRLNWDKQYQRDSYRPQLHDEADAVYFEGKSSFEAAQRKHNAEIRFLKESFEDEEKAAIEKYASVILAASQYPPDIDLDFDVTYQPNISELVVDCLLPSPGSFPLVQEFRYVASRNEIDTKHMSDKDARAFLERAYLSISVRTIHELFEALYTDCAQSIQYNGYILNDEEEDQLDPEDDDFTDRVHRVITVRTTKAFFCGLPLSDEAVNDTVQAMGMTYVKNPLDGSLSV